MAMNEGWWGGPQNDSSDSDYYSSTDDEAKDTEQGMGSAKTFMFDSESDDDDTKRVVRSATEKRFQEMQTIIKKIKNSIKIADWNTISTEWDALLRAVSKAKQVIEQQGPPRFYLALLVSLEDFLNNSLSDKTALKSMKPKMKKFLNNMKLKFKKFLKENEFNIEKLLKEYRDNPGKDDEDEEGGGDDEDKADNLEDATSVKPTSVPSTGKASFWLDNDDGEDEDDHSGSDDEDSDDFEPNRVTREWFFQKDEKKDKKKEKKEKDRVRKEKEKEKEKEKAALSPVPDQKSAGAAPKVDDKKAVEWTQEKVFKALTDALKQRGTKNYDRVETLKQLQMLLTKTEGIGKQFSVRFHIINAHFDCSPSTAPFLSTRLWSQIYNEVVSVLEGLNNNPSVELFESREELLQKYDEDDFMKLPGHVAQGHLLYSIERLHDEFMKSLQNTDSHTQDFLSRLSHERDFLLLLQAAEKFYTRRKDMKRVAAIAYRELDYLYFKRTAQGGGIESVFIPNDDVDDDVQPEEPPPEIDEALLDDADLEADKEKEEDIKLINPQDEVPVSNLSEAVSRLCSLIYKYSTEDRHKRRTMLQQIYHLSLHDRFYEARDLLLMTHLQDKIHRAKTSTQVMFNRAMVQLGLSAFRLGRIEDANNCLQEIIVNGKAKELLAQGMRAHQEKSDEQEKQERSRQIPYHLHINLDLIECVQLVCAMLLEVPNIAQSRYRDSKKKIISKHFRKILDFYERQIFSGPPENTRDAVIVSAKFMEKGEWKKAQQTIVGLDIWKLMPNHEKVLEMLKTEIQIQSLRTYLLVFGQFYNSMLTSELASMFELDQNTVHAVASKMMISDELHASFDQSSGAISFHAEDPTSLQNQALTFAEKLNQNVLVEVTDPGDQRFDRKWVDPRSNQNKQPQQRSRFGQVGLRSDRQFNQQQGRKKQPPTQLQQRGQRGYKPAS